MFNPTQRRQLLGTFLAITMGLLLITFPASLEAGAKIEVVRLIKTIPNSDFIRSGMINFKGKGYFLAEGEFSLPTKLWVTDGTAEGTKPIKTIPDEEFVPMFLTNRLALLSNDRPVVPVTDEHEPIVLNNHFFISTSKHLWKSDGTSIGTVRVAEIDSSKPEAAIVLGNILYILGYNKKIWRTDGTGGGTWLLWQAESKEMALYDGRLFFVGRSSHHGDELWVSDGTRSGTSLFADINPFNDESKHSNPENLVIFNEKLYFTADDGLRGRQLWATDGTRDGTHHVTEIRNGTWFSELMAFEDYLLFNASGGCYRSDGSLGGTDYLGEQDMARYLGMLGGHPYFGESEGIWRSDGTARGTNFVKRGLVVNMEISATSISSKLEGKIYFAGTMRSNGRGDELWVTDGTPTGTRLVKDILPGETEYGNPLGSVPDDFIKINDSLLFFAWNRVIFNDNGKEYERGLFKLKLRELPILSPILDLLFSDDENE